MENPLRDAILQQHEIAWSLLTYHLDGITDEECLWRPRSQGLFVHPGQDAWTADWPEHEAYDIGPPNIAWLTWHIIFWWSMTLNHSFSCGGLTREEIVWPGSIAAAKNAITQLHGEWSERVGNMSDSDFSSTQHTRWPFQDRPFYDVAAWLNLELMKNASEIGYCRFLYATRQ